MKAITYVFMLGAISMLVLPSAYSSLLQLRKSIAKLVAAENLQQEQLSTFCVHQSNITWVEQGSELMYNNQMYDVNSFHSVGDSIVFTGLADSEETSIEISLAKLLKAPVPEKSLQVIGQHIIDFTYSLPPSYELITVKSRFSNSLHAPNRRFDLLQSYPSIPSPPPDPLLTPCS